MSTPALPRPEPSEHEAYYGRYVGLVPDGDIVEILRAQWPETRALLEGVPSQLEEHCYAPGKWSVREVVGHLIDAERLFGYRALAMARGDAQALPPMDQEAWAAASNAHRRPLADLVGEWEAVRHAHIHFFGSLDAEAGARRGVASGYEFTVRSFPWIIAGHERYHRELLRRDYLGGGA